MKGVDHDNWLPEKGGKRSIYHSDGVRTDRRILFVNGIMNTRYEHALTCQRIMNATQCEVLGIYNQKGTENPVASTVLKAATSASVGGLFSYEKLAFDLGQCISDSAGLIARGALGYTGNTPNDCTYSLLDYLLQHGADWPNKPITIMAHSQGNLITSNALMLYSAYMRFPELTKNTRLAPYVAKGAKNIHVFAVASPAMTWPTNNHISVHTYWHRFDVVTAFSGGRNNKGYQNDTSTVTGIGFGHGLDTYLDDKLFVDSVCKYMGTKPRYKVAPEENKEKIPDEKKFNQKWRYLDEPDPGNASLGIASDLNNSLASVLDKIGRTTGTVSPGLSVLRKAGETLVGR
jgi:hypothetical protein